MQKALQKFVQENPRLVTMRESESYPGLFVLKYKKTVFFDNLWNEFLEECRGTIVDADFNVVSRPFTKIYNFRVESKSPVLADSVPVTAYRKVNGFMVAVTWSDLHQRMIVSTTGSTDSDYVRMAREMMAQENRMSKWEKNVHLSRGHTLMFECVHPDDPHIIPEDAGMYFLGWRANTWDSKTLGHAYGDGIWRRYALNVLHCKYAESFQTTVGELVAMSKTVHHEGFVAYTKDGVSFKIKSPYYLVKKFVARNPRTDKLMRPDVKKSLDEEYHPLIDAIQADIQAFTAKDEQERLVWVRGFLEAQ